MARIGSEEAEAGTMRNDAFGIGQPAATADGETPRSATMLRRLAGGAGPWLRRALRTRKPDLSEFSDAQLRDIGLTRADVEPFR
jgi:uncharacterized protein YjiS (DUF1127 family)